MARAIVVQRTYLSLTLFSTLATAMIWGINTLFLLDAGLSNTQAFTANAFFTLGQVLFEIPTGVVADVRGRKVSYLLGAITLMASTAMYLAMWQFGGPFWGWAIASMLIGLGFTFFSGATDAWLVDALAYCGYDGPLESVFARGQVVSGIGMLTGAVAGGILAQAFNLGVPYVVRILLLLVTVVIAATMMRDLGFTPARGESTLGEVRRILRSSVDNGLRHPPVRWLMLEAPFLTGVGFYAFYAAQPYLLDLYGDSGAYGIAGLAAALFGGAQIAGGLAVPLLRRVFRRRTSALVAAATVTAVVLVAVGLAGSFAVVVGLFVVWSLTSAAAVSMRRAYINGEVPSQQRATVLSFDSLMGSAGAVVTQPALGRVADVSGYGASYVVAGALQACAIPFLWLARRTRAPSDPIVVDSGEPPD